MRILACDECVGGDEMRHDGVLPCIRSGLVVVIALQVPQQRIGQTRGRLQSAHRDRRNFRLGRHFVLNSSTPRGLDDTPEPIFRRRLTLITRVGNEMDFFKGIFGEEEKKSPVGAQQKTARVIGASHPPRGISAAAPAAASPSVKPVAGNGHDTT
jgi:hypothetical protein